MAEPNFFCPASEFGRDRNQTRSNRISQISRYVKKNYDEFRSLRQCFANMTGAEAASTWYSRPQTWRDEVLARVPDIVKRLHRYEDLELEVEGRLRELFVLYKEQDEAEIARKKKSRMKATGLSDEQFEAMPQIVSAKSEEDEISLLSKDIEQSLEEISQQLRDKDARIRDLEEKDGDRNKKKRKLR